MNFSQDDIDKIGIVNGFIVHRERNMNTFTDADKQYLLELYGRLVRCVGQETSDRLRMKPLNQLKIKGRDSNRCIMVKPKTKNAFTEELATRGFRLIGERTPVRAIARVRATRRGRAVVPVARSVVRSPLIMQRVVSPNVPARAQTPLGQLISDNSQVEIVNRPPAQVIGSDGNAVLFGRDSVYQRELAARRVPPIPAISNERIIQIVRDTVQETIRDFIATPTPAVGGRKTRRHRRRH